jgi:hypothetical protein
VPAAYLLIAADHHKTTNEAEEEIAGMHPAE